MTQLHGNTGENVLVAIDIAKKRNTVLIHFPDESRKKFMVANKLSDYQEFTAYLKSLGGIVIDDAKLFNEKLKEWEDFYNYNRPHAALFGQTPYERFREKVKLSV